MISDCIDIQVYRLNNHGRSDLVAVVLMCFHPEYKLENYKLYAALTPEQIICLGEISLNGFRPIATKNNEILMIKSIYFVGLIA